MRIAIGVMLASLALASGTASADFALLLKGGKVDLAKEDQDPGFKRSSDDALGIAWEVRKKKDTALGMEYLRYRHNYLAPTSTSRTSVKTQALMFVAKEYFNKDVLRPFIGLGMGLGYTVGTGFFNDDYDTSLVLQVMGGLEMRFQQLGVFAEVKGLYFDQDSRDSYDPSGRGVFVGMSLTF